MSEQSAFEKWWRSDAGILASEGGYSDARAGWDAALDAAAKACQARCNRAEERGDADQATEASACVDVVLALKSEKGGDHG